MGERTRMAPGALMAMEELEKYVRGSVDGRVLELIRLRTSVLIGGVVSDDVRGREVSSWRESTTFSEKERAALDLTDAVTNIGRDGVPEEIWKQAGKFWSERELADITLAIVSINAWNRIAIATQLESALSPS